MIEVKQLIKILLIESGKPLIGNGVEGSLFRIHSNVNLKFLET
jgi:hypothetical protein